MAPRAAWQAGTKGLRHGRLDPPRRNRRRPSTQGEGLQVVPTEVAGPACDRQTVDPVLGVLTRRSAFPLLDQRPVRRSPRQARSGATSRSVTRASRWILQHVVGPQAERTPRVPSTSDQGLSGTGPGGCWLCKLQTTSDTAPDANDRRVNRPPPPRPWRPVGLRCARRRCRRRRPAGSAPRHSTWMPRSMQEEPLDLRQVGLPPATTS